MIERIPFARAPADANAVHAFVEHKLDLAAKCLLVDFAARRERSDEWRYNPLEVVQFFLLHIGRSVQPNETPAVVIGGIRFPVSLMDYRWVCPTWQPTRQSRTGREGLIQPEPCEAARVALRSAALTQIQIEKPLARVGAGKLLKSG